MDFTADRKTECIWATDIHSYFPFDEFQNPLKLYPFSGVLQVIPAALQVVVGYKALKLKI
jgi:hypothetical protein